MASPAQLCERATVICIGVPPGVRFGYDTCVHETGPKFMGVKLIPPGQHIISTSMSEDGVATSILVQLRAGDVAVYTWDAREEYLTPTSDEAEVARYSSAVQRLELDSHLAPYDTARYHVWKTLSSHVTAAVMERVRPVGLLVHSERELGAMTPLARQLNEANEMAEVEDESDEGVLISAASLPNRGTFLYFTPIPGHGAYGLPADRTAYAMDTSFAVLGMAAQLMAQGHAEQGSALHQHIIGEMQLGYILFVFGRAFSGLEAWKRLFDALCRAEDVLLGLPGTENAVLRAADALASTESGRQRYHAHAQAAVHLLDATFFSAVFTGMCSQIRTLPPDTFATDLTENNFLVNALTALVRTCKSMPGSASAPLASSSVRLSIVKLAHEWKTRFGLSIPGTSDLDGNEIGRLSAGGGRACGDATPVEYGSREELLAALAADGDGDLPAIVEE